jgi:hypothetical protein
MNCRECGTALLEQTDLQAQRPDIEDPRRTQGRKLMLRGFIWFVGGSALTLFSYSAAVRRPYGGTYVVAFGAIIGGIVQLIRGAAAAGGNDKNVHVRDLLNMAARLESEDPGKAVALYEEIARKFPGTRAGNEAQRNIQTLTAHRE